MAPRLPRLACPRSEKSLAQAPSLRSRALPPPPAFALALPATCPLGFAGAFLEPLLELADIRLGLGFPGEIAASELPAALADIGVDLRPLAEIAAPQLAAALAKVQYLLAFAAPVVEITVGSRPRISLGDTYS